MSRKLSGAHVAHHKNTSNMQPVPCNPKSTVTIPMSMHIGAPCKPLVKPADEVKVGQIIGDNPEAFICAPIHSSVSGKVKSIADFTMPNGSVTKAVIIESDGLFTVSDDVKPPVVNTKEDLIKAARDCGLVGLGGAGFPSHVKLNPKNPETVDTLLINAAECEPFITVDNRECIDGSEDVLFAVRTIMKLLNLKKAAFGIESNKPDAIAHLTEATKNDDNIDVITLDAMYPQGAEKVLIYSATGRIVPEGKLPSDVGVIVFNVSSLGKLAKYLKTGMPLTTKNITVDGGAITKPQNLTVPIGTPISDIAEFCGGYKVEPRKIIMGGPMMGTAMKDDSFPIIKNTNAVLFFDSEQTKPRITSACIRCGRCIRTCPYSLMPVSFERAYERKDVDALNKLKINMCMECGCCEFICPANRKLVAHHKLSKQLVKKAQG